MTATTKRIRIRHAGGASTIDVPPRSTAGDVARLIESAVPSMTSDRQAWKSGYPPRPHPPCGAAVDFPVGDVDVIHVSLADGPGDVPTVDFRDGTGDGIGDVGVIEEPPNIDPDGTIVRRVMDSDNSCLFNSIGYALLGRSRRDAAGLRRMVARAVRDDPDTFTEAFLGKSPEDYVAFITDPKAWGGQIELLVFSRVFESEIAAFDIIRDRVDVYGSGEGYKRRVFVIYDGIHYDALAFAFDESLPEEMDVTQFSPADELAMAKAGAVCADQHRKKAFTDTSSFALRCGVCQVGLKGAAEAQEHAQQTGHTNFAEFR